jgi:hypothetical protein
MIVLATGAPGAEQCAEALQRAGIPVHAFTHNGEDPGAAYPA